MLIYEKLVADKRKLFAAEGNVPTEADVEVTYKTADGTAIELTRDRFVYSRDGKLFVAPEGEYMPGEADAELGVFAGDKQLVGAVEIKVVDPTPAPTEPVEEPSTQAAKRGRKPVVEEPVVAEEVAE